MGSSPVTAASVEPEVLAAIVAGGVSLVVAALTALLAYATQKRERQRELYGQAFKAALAWEEMLYRVRRRAAGDEADRGLIERFHSLQEEIDYYRGWIGSESPFLARSYSRLVDAVKDKTGDDIDAAWKEEHRRSPSEGAREGDHHPDCGKASEAFLFDVRWHLSLLPPLRVVVVWRNRRWPKRSA